MLEIKNLRDNGKEISFDYSCDGGEWGKARYSYKTRKYIIDEYAENDSPESRFYKNYFYHAIEQAKEYKSDNARVMWY